MNNSRVTSTLQNDELENKPFFQATIGDIKEMFKQALREIALEEDQVPDKRTDRKVYGIEGIAKELGISVSSVNRLLKNHKIDGAITRIGKSISADVDALWAILKCNQFLRCA